MVKPLARAGLCAALLASSVAAEARGAFFPTYHPKPCSGEECRADDARSGSDCQGLICSFTSAKSLQRPVMASEAAAMQAKAEAAVPAPAADGAAKGSRQKRKTTAKHVDRRAKPVGETSSRTADAAPDARPDSNPAAAQPR